MNLYTIICAFSLHNAISKLHGFITKHGDCSCYPFCFNIDKRSDLRGRAGDIVISWGVSGRNEDLSDSYEERLPEEVQRRQGIRSDLHNLQ